ncbi:MAG TPA: hypothetical protein VMZ31_00105 [Phycisphaerae bacterium]|nr:hypothetical protein [Phycisphaerae bacterium]
MASYVELRQLFGNGDLRNKIEVACIVAAEAIRTEDAGTANHANRLIWAKKAFSSPNGIRDEMLMALLAANKDSTVQDITGVTDEPLQTLVNAAVDVFADGS